MSLRVDSEVRQERLLVDGDSAALRGIKIVHTIVWAFMAGCILAIPWVSWRGEYRTAGGLVTIVLGEVAVLALNRGRCPPTLSRCSPNGLASQAQQTHFWLDFHRGCDLCLGKVGANPKLVHRKVKPPPNERKTQRTGG
jgi:hypothetical protein